MQKNSESANRLSTHGSRIYVPGRKQTEIALSSSKVALDGTRKKLQKRWGLSRNRTSEIVGNTSFSNIDTLLTPVDDMEYIASHYQTDLALAWALRLQGKTDQEKLQELGCGASTWDQWHFNECDERFGFGNGWPAPLSSERLTGKQVQKMQDKHILGTIGRTLLIAKKV